MVGYIYRLQLGKAALVVFCCSFWQQSVVNVRCDVSLSHHELDVSNTVIQNKYDYCALQ